MWCMTTQVLSITVVARCVRQGAAVSIDLNVDMQTLPVLTIKIKVSFWKCTETNPPHPVAIL